MNAKKLALLAAILVGPVLVQSAAAAQAPNYYECRGGNVSLSLTVGSQAEVGILPPKTALNLQIGQKDYHFEGSEISTESTLIGDLWEVTLDFVADAHIDHASVVIPEIALDGTPLKFKSQLILTRVETPFIPAPFVGVVNPSRYIDINCAASQLFF
ncbi:hypothetical protein QZJ86_18805 [Methylomonas montana]|uniref:hypothetical protein n=1 Tax=Methylomonas montana TaxID=3058963 RepID=UPI00265AFFF6|nr:hypothetical protein [Methylomonas montana]WKJ90034.1 hypothetical protein QZJ86_18805 [Methylomonas montana]